MAKEKTITVLSYTGGGGLGKLVEIENTLKSLQNMVGGLIECIHLTDDTDLICNEEGMINELPVTAKLDWKNEDGALLRRTFLRGPFFLCCYDDRGNFTSYKEDIRLDLFDLSYSFYYMKHNKKQLELISGITVTVENDN